MSDQLHPVFVVRLPDGRYVSRSQAQPTRTMPRTWVKEHDALRMARKEGGEVRVMFMRDRDDMDLEFSAAVDLLTEVLIQELPVGRLHDCVQSLGSRPFPPGVRDLVVSAIQKVMLDRSVVGESAEG